MNHELKTWPCYYAAIISGRKTFEVRYDRDRGFQAGDMLLLREQDPRSASYTGRQCVARIGYVTAFEQKPGWVVFSLLDVKERP